MNKYLISADIEGITGVVSRSFANEGGSHYQLACSYMLSDVNAVLQGIINADPNSEIIVRDAHGVNAANLNLEKLHPKARLVQGWSSVQNMFTGLEKGFKGVFLVGFHAGGQNLEAVLGHALHSIVDHVKLNGELINETGIFGLYAGYYDVPIAFISGDNHAIKEANEQLGNVIGVIVKKSYGRACADSLSLEYARILLEKGASDAVVGLLDNKFKPFKFSRQLNLEIKFYDSGYRISIFQKLADILEFDPIYKFDYKEHAVTYNSDDALILLNRLNLIMYVVYGIVSSM